MKDDVTSSKPPPAGRQGPAKAARLAREAAALRANLRKRKQQAREREAPVDREAEGDRPEPG